MTERDLEAKFALCTISDLRFRIMRRDEESDAAAYYLLRYRMIHALRWHYNQMRMKDELCDVLQDFFMFIRDGKGKNYSRKYQALEGLRSWWSFEPFVERIFQRFLLDRYENEQKHDETVRLYNQTPSSEYSKIRDKKIHCMGMLLAYVDETYEPRNRFVFYRSLLKDMNKTQMILNEKMAVALGTTYANYRQVDSRGRSLAKSKLDDFLRGVTPELSDQGVLLVERVENDFEAIDVILKDLYFATLDELDCKDAIEELRLEENTEKSNVSFSLKGGSTRYSISDDEESRPSAAKFSRKWKAEFERPNDVRFRRQSVSPDVVMDFSDLDTKTLLLNKINKWLTNFMNEQQ